MTLKLRAKVNFPASVTGAAGIAVTKLNGIWTISPDFGALTELTAVPNPANRQLWIYTPSAGIYNVVTFETLSNALNSLPIGSDLDLDGNKITNLADGTDDGDAINKGQADAAYQPIDDTLTSLSALGTAADKLAYSTGVDTWAETPLTSAARGLLDDTSVGAMRTTLGVGIGTDVQAYDPGLQSISGLTTAADKMIYTTASDTYAVTTLTTFARTILDDTDASSVRTTLGLVIGSNVQAYNARLSDISGITYAQGDILYYDGTNLVKLAKGTDGQFLKITATIPEWATLAGGGDMLSTNNLSDVASTDTSLDNLGGTTVGKAVFTATDEAAGRSALSVWDSSYFRGFISGLAMSAPGSGTILTITEGASNSDDFTTLMKTTSTYTKTLSSWTVGTGNGGLDTGSVANNTWYHVFQIVRTDTDVVDFLISTSATTPTLPTNYTKQRRIGSLRTDGSGNIRAFFQVSDTFIWGAPIQDASASNPGTSAVSRTLTVPTGVVVEAILNCDVHAQSSNFYCLLSPLSAADTTPSASAFTFNASASGTGIASFEQSGQVRVLTNTSAQIRSRQSVSGASDTLTLVTVGWRDFRGQ